MANYTNSTLTDWLSDRPSPQLYPCYQHVSGPSFGVEVVSCVQVCNDIALLFDPLFQSKNLVNCGRWSALVISASPLEQGPNHTIIINDKSIQDEIIAYEAVGLNASDYHLAPESADIISTWLAYMYTSVVSFSFLDDHKVKLECTRAKMFPGMFSTTGYSTGSFEDGRAALATCLDSLCSPITLNPELAGIGVSVLCLLFNSVRI